MSTLAAPRMGDAAPISYLNAWWGLVQSFVVGLIIIAIVSLPLLWIGMAAGLPVGPPGASEEFLHSPSDMLAWPLDPSLMWFQAVNLLALASIVLWLGVRLRDRFRILDLELGLADALLSVGGLMVIAALSHAAGVVATFVIAGLLRRVGGSPAPAATVRRRRWGRWIAASWAVAMLGSLAAVNVVPVSAEVGGSCGMDSGTVSPQPNATLGTGDAPIPYPFRRGGTFTTCAMATNRAWFTHVTVLGLDHGQLDPHAPWQISIERQSDRAALYPFVSVQPFSLAPGAERDVFVLVRFTSCGPGMRGRTFSLAGVPLLVRAYGRTQTDLVRFGQPVQTTCPY